MKIAGIDLVHVPYKGDPAALIDLIAGRVQLLIATQSTSLPFVKEGKLRALAITNSARSEGWPDVPTLAEQGVTGYDFPYWNGLFVAKGTPDKIVRDLHRAVLAALAEPDVKERFKQLGLVAVGNAPEEFREIVRRDVEKYRRIVKESGIPQL